MTAIRTLGRALAALLAAAVGLLLFLHMSIVAGYAPPSTKALAAILGAAAIIVTLVAMWVLGRPRSVVLRTLVCIGLFASYVLLSVWT